MYSKLLLYENVKSKDELIIMFNKSIFQSKMKNATINSDERQVVTYVTPASSSSTVALTGTNVTTTTGTSSITTKFTMPNATAAKCNHSIAPFIIVSTLNSKSETI